MFRIYKLKYSVELVDETTFKTISVEKSKDIKFISSLNRQDPEILLVEDLCSKLVENIQSESEESKESN